MTVKSKPYFWLECDAEGCESRSPNGDYSAWADEFIAVDDALSGDWKVTDDGRHFCERHRNFICDDCGAWIEDVEYPGEQDYLCTPCWEKEQAERPLRGPDVQQNED